MRVRDGGRLLTIRLACIDAPEIAQRPHGARAREALQQLAPVGAEVTLEVQTTDRYGRSVAEVFRGGENVNLALVRQGAAFAFRKYLGQCNSLRYLSAESEAEFRRVGVWATPWGITRPWDWRAESRGEHTGTRTTSAQGASFGEL
jgi:endonuclease YncB( thermonuclease family)